MPCNSSSPQRDRTCASRDPGRRYAVDIVLVEGFQITELAEIVDCIEVWKRLADPTVVTLSLLSPHGGPITGSHTAITVDTTRAQVSAGPGILVMLGASTALASGVQLARLWTHARRQGRYLVAFSETVSALKRRGVFGDDVVCTHWSDPIAQDARWSEEVSDTTIFHIDSQRTTGAGRSSAVHAVLNLIAREFGQEIVNRIAEHLLIGDVRTTTAFQRYSVKDRYLVDDLRIAAMLDIMETEIEEKILISEIAARLGISTRQLERLCRRHLGTPPLRTLEVIRMRKARWLLERTAMPIIEISMACGFSSPSLFSKCFRRHHGAPPLEVRKAGLKSGRRAFGMDEAVTPLDVDTSPRHAPPGSRSIGTSAEGSKVTMP